MSGAARPALCFPKTPSCPVLLSLRRSASSLSGADSRKLMWLRRVLNAHPSRNLPREAGRSWRKLKGYELVEEIVSGLRFEDGVEVQEEA